MIELVVLYLLGKKNMSNAIARGRKPGGFIALTIILWFGFEIIGIVIGLAANLGQQAYAGGMVFGAIGGFGSYQIAKHCKLGTDVPLFQSEIKKNRKR